MNRINKSLMIGSLLLVVAIPLTTWLVGKNQENRSKAASETETATSLSASTPAVDGVCGEADGTTVTSIPGDKVACAAGALNWMDTKATDGSYNWKCIGTVEGTAVDCSATKK